jgi:2-dehydropantoate 2-reductase
MTMRILVLGAGGTGGYFGGRLAEAGADVTFLVRPRRREQLERDGLRISGPLGDVRLDVATVSQEELRPEYDLVLLTCKAYDLDSAMDAIAPAMTGQCAVLPLLNGMSHFDVLNERFGSDAVMWGTCVVNAELLDDGVIEQTSTLQRIIFGERNREKTPRAKAFADALSLTQLDWELADDIERNLWEKMSQLSAMAALTCLFRASIGDIIAAPGGPEAIDRTIRANIEIITREGFPPRPEAVAFVMGQLTKPGNPMTASLMRDMEAGKRVEGDHILGTMLDKAHEHGVDDTMLSLAYTHVKAYEARRADGRLPRS